MRDIYLNATVREISDWAKLHYGHSHLPSEHKIRSIFGDAVWAALRVYETSGYAVWLLPWLPGVAFSKRFSRTDDRPAWMKGKGTP